MKKQIVCLMIFLAGISFNGFSQATFTIPESAGCAIFCVTPQDQSTNGISWFWEFGDGGTSTVQFPAYCYYIPGVYTITLIEQFASGPDTAYGTVTVYALPVAAFTSTNTGNNTVNFTDQSIGGVATWYWNFGDATNATQQNPSHTYASWGSYTVFLTVTSNMGCVDSVSQIVTPTGLNDYHTEIGYTIYPNPSTGKISIHFESALQNAEVLRVENMLGEIILQKEISSDATIDLSDQAAGIYFVRIGNSSPQKVMIE